MAEIAELQSTIDAAFEERAGIAPSTTGPARAAVEEALSLLDQGKLRVAEKGPSGWTVNQWLKKAVLLSFRLNPMAAIKGGPGEASWWDKVPSKFDGWGAQEFEHAGFRAVPNCIVRHSAYIAPGVVLMPSFVNLGAYVDEGTMVDTWATVGSCAQIGKNCHLSGGVGIGGVLEPLQAEPDHHRGQLLHRRALGSGRRRGRRRGLGAVDGRLHRRLDQDRRSRHRRDPHGPRAALFGGRLGRAAGQAAARTASRARRSIARSSSSASMRRRGRKPRSTSC